MKRGGKFFFSSLWGEHNFLWGGGGGQLTFYSTFTGGEGGEYTGRYDR